MLPSYSPALLNCRICRSTRKRLQCQCSLLTSFCSPQYTHISGGYVLCHVPDPQKTGPPPHIFFNRPTRSARHLFQYLSSGSGICYVAVCGRLRRRSRIQCEHHNAESAYLLDSMSRSRRETRYVPLMNPDSAPSSRQTTN